MGGSNSTRNNREIERKFLVKWLPDNLKRSRSFVIEQGYLATESAGRQVRLRKTDSTASLTFKVGRGSHREEREIKLSQNNSQRSGLVQPGEDCEKCATKFHGKIC